MSNPGVKILAKSTNGKGKIKRFVLEDNIGESIHLHMDNMRIDFTINEFFQFTQIINESLLNLNILKGYEIGDFDINFLKTAHRDLNRLVNIKKEKVKIKDLSCVTHFKYRSLILEKIQKIHDSPVYNFLRGDKREFINYPQYNYLGVNNEARLTSIINSIEENGYPYQNNYIILFNGQNIIRDGQHRAAILAYRNDENYEVEVLRFYFKDNQHFLNFRKQNTRRILVFIISKLKEKINVIFNRY